MNVEVKGAINGLAHSSTIFAIPRTNILEFFDINTEKKIFSDSNNYMKYMKRKISDYDASKDFTFVDVSYCCGKFAVTTSDGYVLFYSLSSSGIEKTGKVYITRHYTQRISLLKEGFVACGNYCGYFDFNGEIKEDVWFDVPIEGRVRRIRVSGPNLYVATNDAVEVYDLMGERRHLYTGDVFDIDVAGDLLAVATRHSIQLFKGFKPLGEVEVDAYSVRIVSENKLLVGGYRRIYELERTETGWMRREIRARRIGGIVENVSATVDTNGDEVIIATTTFNWYVIKQRRKKREEIKEEAIPITLPQ